MITSGASPAPKISPVGFRKALRWGYPRIFNYGPFMNDASAYQIEIKEAPMVPFRHQRIVIAILLAALLAGCASTGASNRGATPLARAYNDLSVAQDLYDQAGPVLQSLRNAGAISKDQWNNQVVPADAALDKAFAAAWSGLETWKKAGGNKDIMAAVADALDALDAFAALSDNPQFKDLVAAIRATFNLIYNEAGA